MSRRSDDLLPQVARFLELLELAYNAELTRVCHVMKALECAQDESLRREWRARISEARARAAMLARMLSELGADPAGASAAASDRGDCLLDAMELALRNGDLAAAEAVARECVLLAEVHCTQAWRRMQEAMTVGATLAA
jgi:hypothetical protein